MTARAIAALETQRLLRSPGIWLAALGFSTVLAGGVSIPYLTGIEADAATGSAFLLGPAVDLLLPLIAILLTFGAIAGHRAAGSIHVFFSAPITRRGVLTGVLFSRILVLWMIVAVGMLVGVGTTVLLYGVPPIMPVVQFTVLTLVGAAVFVSVGVGVSALTASPIRALTTLIGGFIVVYALLEPLLHGVSAATMGSSEDVSRSVDHALLVSPLESYGRIAHGILPPTPHLDVAVDGSDATAETGALVGGEIATVDLFTAIGMLLAWASVLLVIGWVRFERAEID